MQARSIASVILAAGIVALAGACTPEPEPSGASALDRPERTNCDGLIQTALIVRKHTEKAQVQETITALQKDRHEPCGPESWAPEIADTQRCARVATNPEAPVTLNQLAAPQSLIKAMQAPGEDGISRDQDGNIMVAFKDEARPLDNALCWLYVAEHAAWELSEDGPQMDCATMWAPGEADAVEKCRLEAGTVIHSDLQEQMDAHSGEAAEPAIDIVVFTTSHQTARKVAGIILQEGTGPVAWTYSTLYSRPSWGAQGTVPKDVILQIAMIAGVIAIQEAHLEPG